MNKYYYTVPPKHSLANIQQRLQATFNALHRSLYIIQYTLYTLYIVHYTLYIIHYTLYIIHYTLSTFLIIKKVIVRIFLYVQLPDPLIKHVAQLIHIFLRLS